MERNRNAKNCIIQYTLLDKEKHPEVKYLTEEGSLTTEIFRAALMTRYFANKTAKVISGDKAKVITFRSAYNSLYKSITGEKFGSLTVKAKVRSHDYYICQCDCGNFVKVSGYNLHHGLVRFCNGAVHDIPYSNNSSTGVRNISRYVLNGKEVFEVIINRNNRQYRRRAASLSAAEAIKKRALKIYEEANRTLDFSTWDFITKPVVNGRVQW